LSPNAPDTQIAMRMVSLLSRGRAALEAYIVSRPVHLQPMGGVRGVVGINVVTREDFVASPELCLDHATVNGALIHILSPDGQLAALIENYKATW
jgi:hypothetical protein